jgi:hypothetical protein
MNIYHWIAVIFLADLALAMTVFLPFVRGADERRGEAPKRKTKLGVQ